MRLDEEVVQRSGPGHDHRLDELRLDLPVGLQRGGQYGREGRTRSVLLDRELPSLLAILAVLLPAGLQRRAQPQFDGHVRFALESVVLVVQTQAQDDPAVEEGQRDPFAALPWPVPEVDGAAAALASVELKRGAVELPSCGVRRGGP